ncbi:MAG: formyltransferase [Nitrospirae bacterium]|nr:formyltransferase [Nitrospirota bacterium]
MNEPGIVIFAYHDVGYECLSALIGRGERIPAVFTHPDSPGENVWFRSVADLARRHGIAVHTPDSLGDPAWIARVRDMNPDLIFSFYYRNIIPQEVLDLPRLGAFNMHGSLLPRYRGRAPVNWAVLNGEKETGATLHHMIMRPDAGDIVDQEPVPIGPDETARDVFEKVTRAARRVLERRIDALKTGIAPRRPQDESQATAFGRRRPEDGRIDWTRSAQSIYNLIRAVTHPYPGAFTHAGGRKVAIWWARPLPGGGGRPGEVLSTDRLRVAAGSGSLEIVKMQRDGANEEEAGGGAHGLRTGQVLGGTS